MINVKPKQLLGSTISRIIIGVIELVIDSNSAVIPVDVFDADGVTVTSKSITIEGAAYEAWGSDDSYIIDFVLAKLGLERE